MIDYPWYPMDHRFAATTLLVYLPCNELLVADVPKERVHSRQANSPSSALGQNGRLRVLQSPGRRGHPSPLTPRAV